MSVNHLKKMSGKERRQFIVNLLKQRTKPITGKELADKANVSRQVIVTDVALLKTSNEPIIATNRGYLYLKEQPDDRLFRRVVACKHSPEQTKDELDTIVDCGVTVVDVIVEHPIYGDLTGSLRISSRYDVNQFMESFSKHEAVMLSVLTDGFHLHTLEADTEGKIDAACHALEKSGLLYTEAE